MPLNTGYNPGMKTNNYKRLANVFTLSCLLIASLLMSSALGDHHTAEGADSDGTEQEVKMPLSLLIYSRTTGYRHKSIEAGVKAITKLGDTHGYRVNHTEAPDEFTDEKLADYDAVIFMSTSGDVLDEAQQQAFKRYIQSGGGFVGVHSASGTEYDWPWYGKLVGAYFTQHPAIQETDIHITKPDHVCVHDMPNPWTWTDEWYNFRDVQPGLTVLATVDETSYEGGDMGEHHPLIWCQEYDGGRSFYTAIGHSPEAYEDPAFIGHLHNGILWAADRSKP